jgi:hypothetical protein
MQRPTYKVSKMQNAANPTRNAASFLKIMQQVRTAQESLNSFYNASAACETEVSSAAAALNATQAKLSRAVHLSTHTPQQAQDATILAALF